MGLYREMAGVALRRPSLWPALAGLAWASRRRGWWRRPPFLPLPPADFLEWRSETAWGDSRSPAPTRDVVRFLRWARRMRRGR